MEYNELIEKVQQTSVDVPDTDAILGGIRHTVRRRRQQRQLVFSLTIILAVGASAYFMQPRQEKTITLAELVSRDINTPPSHEPAPIVGYRNSIHNHQIYTLL